MAGSRPSSSTADGPSDDARDASVPASAFGPLLGFAGGAAFVSLLILMDILHTQAATFVLMDSPTRDRYAYPLIAASGATVDGPGGGGNMVVPVAEFGYWVTVEALVLGVAIIGVGLLISVLVNHRSPS